MHSGLFKIYLYQEYGEWQAGRQTDRMYDCTKCRSIDRTSTKGFQAQNLKLGQIKAVVFWMEMGTHII
jgi:hypothetical protein